MMGPEAALVCDRLSEIRRLGGYPVDVPTSAVPMYAEAAARARLEAPRYRARVWARLRVALFGRAGTKGDAGAAWSVAAAPIAAKEERSAWSPELGMAGATLAALPLQKVADD